MKIRLKIKQITLITVLLVISFGCLATALYFSPFIQKNRYFRAYKIEKEAKKFPPNSNEYLRLIAIANAIRKGEKTYTYIPNFNPMNLGK